MANERAWGAALQSLGGSVMDYYKQKSQEQVQAERDRKLAEAIIAREHSDFVNKTLAQQLEDQTIMRQEQPGISYPLPPTPQQQLGPVVQPAPAPYDYIGAITTPPTPARPATLSEIPGVVESYYGRQEVPQDYYLTPKGPKPITEYQTGQLELGTQLLALQRERAISNAKADYDFRVMSGIVKDYAAIGYENLSPEQRIQYTAWRKMATDRGINISDIDRISETASPEESGIWTSIKKIMGWKSPKQAKPAAKPVTQPVTTIRVRIGNQTGTINSDEFDPKTMVKI